MRARNILITILAAAMLIPCGLQVRAEADTACSGLFTIDLRDGDWPLAFNIESPQGRHFIEGMPGTLTFKADINWNGSPGSAYFTINGTRYTAGITDLGGGLARAEVTVAAPAAVGTCSEVTLEAVNAEGKRVVMNAGLYFHPIPGIIVPWYRDNIPWTPSGLALTYSDEFSWSLPEKSLGDRLKFKMGYGYDRSLAYDALAGSFKGELGGFLEGALETEVREMEVYLEGKARVAGSLTISHAGCSPVITPAVGLSGGFKVGVGAPVVIFVEVVFPPAIGPVEFLLGVPIVCDVVGALKAKAYFTPGFGVSGEWENFQSGDCFLGMTSTSGSVTLGVEGQACLELWGAEAGIYAGGSCTPQFQICPEMDLNGLTIRGYVGVFASAFLFKYSQEIGCELSFDDGGSLAKTMNSSRKPTVTTAKWQPIGASLLEYGDMNRAPKAASVRTFASTSAVQSGGSTEETLRENVTNLSGPCVLSDAQGTCLLYMLLDPEKPWYASTDIAMESSESGGEWVHSMVTDDELAEFTPEFAAVDADNALAAWTRVTGDISGTTDPGEIAPYLDIVTARLNLQTNEWTAPEQLTANGVVDRDPVPAVFGSNEGILWVQNEAGASPGNATYGDSLMYSAFSGTAWGAPQVLWSAKKSATGIAFVADGAGEGHAVFVVDEDGDQETRTDRELYGISTTSGSWDAAVRLTNDSVEDSVPALVAPDGAPMLVWNAGGILTYTPLDTWSPQSVYSEHTIANEAASLHGATMPGGAAIGYAVQLPTGMDIVASFYDAALDTWSLPRQLTLDADVETALSLGCEGGQLVIGYLKNRTVRGPVDVEIDGQPVHLEDIPQPTQTDLCVLRHALGHDLAVGSVTLDPANPVQGASATITAAIENRGDLPESDIDVAFYDGDPQGGGALIGSIQTVAGPVVAGESVEVTAPWTVSWGEAAHELFVVVDADLSVDDRDRSNNTASLLCVLPDLAVETGWSTQVGLDSVALTAEVVNQGAIIAEGFEVSWRQDGPTGAEIGRSPVDMLEAGASTEVSYLWTLTEPAGTDFLQVCAVVDCENVVPESDESNNVGCQTVRAPAMVETPTLTVGAAKLLPADSLVYLQSKAVTAAFPDYLYLEEPDRSAGLRVLSVAVVGVGETVSVTGRLDASGYELTLIPDVLSSAGLVSDPVAPLWLVGRSLGGKSYGLQPAVLGGASLSNIGVLVRTCGGVTQVGADYLYVDDGSALKDGGLTGMEENIGVRVICDPAGYQAGDKVEVTGISSCFWTPSGIARRILTRGPEDVRKIAGE